MNEPIKGEWQTGKRSAACYKREIERLTQQRDDLLAACERFVEVKILRDNMWRIIENRKDGLVGIQVRKDTLAKEYQKLYTEREILKQTVYPLIEAAIKKGQ